MRTSIVVVDGFYADPAETRAEALRQPFLAEPDYHKGKRGPKRPFEGPACDYLAGLLAGPGAHGRGYWCYQVCVAGEQLVYHSDSQRYAAVVFLTPGAPVASGTSFFRSLATGIRSSDELAPRGGTAGAAELERRTYGGKLLDRTAWEEVDRVGNVFNRLVAWDGHLIHAATDYFGAGLEDGRLFQIFFWDPA